jgi:protein O-GlcNAc transferase
VAKFSGLGHSVDAIKNLGRKQFCHAVDRVAKWPALLATRSPATPLDAFWMGVPTVTLLGQTMVGRAGWSLLCNLGLQDLAAETPGQYIVLAARLAADLPRLHELRGTLRQRMQQSPLMGGQRFARHVEQAYRQIWRRWCHGRPALLPG